jgi:GTP cyclohydrolase I
MKDQKYLYESAGVNTKIEFDRITIQKSLKKILLAVGEDPGREGLKRTPARVARMYDELLSGYRVDPLALVNEAIFHVDYDEMVIIKDIEFYSLCEHHLLPFMGRAHIAYIPKGKIIGLSKIPRLLDMFSHRLQIQERMTHQVANFIYELLEPQGVGVVIEAMHLCSMMRGVKKHDARLTTSAMLGSFRANHSTRMEFLDNISRNAQPLIF